MIAEVLPPEVDALAVYGAEAEGSEIETRAAALEILSAEGYEEACALERLWSEREKVATGLFEDAREASHLAWKRIVALQERVAGPYGRARRTLKAKIGEWREQERRRAEDEARRLREVARRQAEDEALARAKALQDRGRLAEAEALIARPVIAPVVAAVPPPSRMGVTSQKRYGAEVHDFAALICWVAERPAERQHYLLPAMPALNRQAVSMKEAMNGDPAPIPGVRATSKFC